MWLDYGAALCQPDVFDRALGGRIHQVSNIKLRHCLTMRPRAVLEADPDGHHIFAFSLHYSSYDRKKHDEGRCNYIPVNLGEIPDYYRRFIDPVDIVVLKTCPLDGNGYYNLSAANLWHHAVIERARIVIVETSRGLPHVHGEQTGLHVSEVDYVIEGDDARRLNSRTRRSARSTPPSDGSSRRKSRTGIACRSGSAACQMPYARCCFKAACAILACTPR